MTVRQSVTLSGVALYLLSLLALPFAADWFGISGHRWPYWFAGYSLLFFGILFLIDWRIATRRTGR